MAHTHTHTHALTHTHTRTHARTHTHTHAHYPIIFTSYRETEVIRHPACHTQAAAGAK